MLDGHQKRLGCIALVVRLGIRRGEEIVKG